MALPLNVDGKSVVRAMDMISTAASLKSGLILKNLSLTEKITHITGECYVSCLSEIYSCSLCCMRCRGLYSLLHVGLFYSPMTDFDIGFSHIHLTFDIKRNEVKTYDIFIGYAGHKHET